MLTNQEYFYDLFELDLKEYAFLISDHKFKNIVEHLHNEGINEQIHGNTGRAHIYKTKVNIDENLKSIVRNFLNQYSLIHGLLSPMRHGNGSGAFIYLPTDKKFISVKLWNELMPNLKFQPPASDNCVQFKSKLQLAKRNIDEYNKVGAEFNEHKKRQTLNMIIITIILN
nr:5080_t:CDS:2 [Entrophospora candida]